MSDAPERDRAWPQWLDINDQTYAHVDIVNGLRNALQEQGSLYQRPGEDLTHCFCPDAAEMPAKHTGRCQRAMEALRRGERYE